jgi:hypothetical protein
LTNERTKVISFFLPFLLGGAYFSMVAVTQLRQLPSEICGSLDYLYAITLAFQDMGLACGIGGLLTVSICEKLAPAFAKVRCKAKRE